MRDGMNGGTTRSHEGNLRMGVWTVSVLCVCAVILLCWHGRAAAQQAAASVRPAAVQAPAPAQEGYAYKPEGRRDPFVSLINRGTDGRQAKKKPEGIAGLMFSEIALRGIVMAPTGPLAVVQGPDRSYIVHVGDRLFDGVVKSITADSVVVVQEVNDPLSLAKQREVRKTLRVVEEVK